MQEMVVVNVKELKQSPKNSGYEDEPTPDLKAWIIKSLYISGLLLLLGFVSLRLLFLLPLPPICAYLAWHVRRIGKNLDRKHPLIR